MTPSGGIVNPYGVNVPGGGTLQNHFDELYAKKADINNLNVLDRLNYQGYTAYWGQVVSDIGNTMSVSFDKNYINIYFHYTTRTGLLNQHPGYYYSPTCGSGSIPVPDFK